MASFDEIVSKMTAAIKGVREAVLGKDVREFIAIGYESVLDAYKQFKTAITEAIDPTLSLSGKAADAKATGAAVDKLEDKKADKADLDTERKRIDRLNEGGLNLKDEVINTSIKAWLDSHPEATTTVQDGAIGPEKLNTALQNNVLDRLPIMGLPYNQNYKGDVLEIVDLPITTYLQGGCSDNKNIFFLDHKGNENASTLMMCNFKGELKYSDDRILGHGNSMGVYNNKLYVLGAKSLHVYNILDDKILYQEAIDCPLTNVNYFTVCNDIFVFVRGGNIVYYKIEDGEFVFYRSAPFVNIAEFRGVWQNCFAYNNIFCIISYIGGATYGIISCFSLSTLEFLYDFTVPTYGHEIEGAFYAERFIYYFCSDDKNAFLAKCEAPRMTRNLENSTYSDKYTKYLVMSTKRMIAYISPSGDDVSGAGTIELPFKTINRALKSFEGYIGLDGFEIVVKSGTYKYDFIIEANERIIVSFDASVTLQSLIITGNGQIDLLGNFTIAPTSNISTGFGASGKANVSSNGIITIDTKNLTIPMMINNKESYFNEITLINKTSKSGVTGIRIMAFGNHNVKKISSDGTIQQAIYCEYGTLKATEITATCSLYKWRTQKGGTVLSDTVN